MATKILTEITTKTLTELANNKIKRDSKQKD